jgi:phospholipase A1
MRKIRIPGPLAAGLLLVVHSVAAADSHQAEPHGLDAACVLRWAKQAAGSTTLDEIRAQCALTPESTGVEESAAATEDAPLPAVEKRLAADRQALDRPFTIMAHRPNYFLVAAWNERGWDPTLYQEQSGDPAYENDDVESQFQISLKVPLAIDLFGGGMDLYGAYTNRSFWQVYNDDYSRPFRETNHEPEIWAQFRNDWTVGGFMNTVNAVGLVHQSNGRSGVLSRSWNRAYATFVFERDDWAFAIKPWVWLRSDREDSDNPDITDYLGHGELRLFYGHAGHVFSLMSRNNLESGFDRGAVELSWSFPVFGYPYLKGYLQYFYGYGESLIDYDRRVNRIGLGISLTDWLE